MNEQCEKWPVVPEKEIISEELPGYVGTIRKIEPTMERKVDLEVIDVSRFNAYKKLINVTCLVLGIVKGKSFRIHRYRYADRYQEAENRWIKFVQQGSGKNWEMTYKRLGVEMDSDGFITV